MKQTNNAIKFLMAQYRAIFKHANIAMVAAMAAAALAAGQAQAANTDWGSLSGDKEKITNETLTYKGGATNQNGNGFTLTIEGGSLTFHGEGANGNFSMNAKSGNIIQTGGKVAIGAANKSGATVDIDSYKITGGELVLGDSTASGDASKLKAKTIIIGDVNPAEGANTATVTVGAKGQLGGDSTTAITLNSGKLDFTDDVTAKTTADGKITITGGAASVGNTKTATFDTPTVEVTGGKVTVKEGATLKVETNKANTIKFAANTIENSGTINLGQSGSSLTVAASDFKSGSGLFKAAASKIAATGKDADQVYNLKLTGAGDVDLGLVIKEDGSALNDTRVNITTGKVNFTADDANVSFSGGKIAVIKSGSFGQLTAGKAGALLIEGTDASVLKGLTVAGAKDNEFGALTLDKGGKLNLAGTGGSVSASSVTVGKTAAANELNVKSGSWTVPSLVMVSGTATVATGASLVIAESGDLSTKKDNAITVKGTLDASKAGKVTSNQSGTTLTGGKLILDMTDVFTKNADGKKVDLISGNSGTFVGDSVSGDTASVLQINNVGDLSVEQITDLKGKLTAFKGFYEFGGENNIASETGDKSWNDISANASINGIYAGVTLTEDTVSGNASIGNIELNGAVDSATIKDATVILNNASANDSTGKFVANKGGAETKGIKFEGDNAKVVFVSAGEVGSITTTNKDKSTVTVGHVNGNGELVVKGGVGTSAAPLNTIEVKDKSSLTISGAATDGLYSNNLKLESGAVLDATGHDVVVGSGADAVANINGSVKAKNLTLAGTGTHNLAGGANVVVEKLNGTKSGTINVGADGVPNGSASVMAGQLTLNQATLNIDPDYQQPYASVIVNNLTTDSGDTLDGTVNVGKNALFAVGFDKKEDVDAVLGSLIKDGHFTDPQPAPGPGPSTRASVSVPGAEVVAPNAVVLNKAIKLTANGGIYVGTKATQASGNKVEVDSGSALVITDKAFDVDPTTGKKSGSAITANNGTGGTATIASGANLVLVGAFNGAENDLEILKGFNGSADQLRNFKVSIGGSELLVADWTADGKLDINLTKDQSVLNAAFAGASSPMKQVLLDVLGGDKYAVSSAAGYSFVSQMATDGNGVAADAAAHAATYAGAQQAAVASVTTMADAMFGRVGAVGVEAASISATGSQTKGGVWLTPMYKSVDADGFNAEGASYGADVDLAGVAFGTDTVKGNMRFGAVFNIGSGDADGKGNGNGLKDEFDYYGFGLYSAMGFGNLALIGDASMTVISHEVEGLGLKGEADTTAVTMGLTGQYTVSTPAVDVTPHLGARFIRLNTDSYDLVGEKGVVANTEFDVQNVFSIPVGVTLSKAFVTGGWSLAPSADLTIAFNTGDTEAKSNTRFTGINKNIGLNTEVLDEVTYGLTVGLGAQYGAFGTSFGINYTGSENTDSFGVNAQARYMF